MCVCACYLEGTLRLPRCAALPFPGSLSSNYPLRPTTPILPPTCPTPLPNLFICFILFPFPLYNVFFQPLSSYQESYSSPAPASAGLKGKKTLFPRPFSSRPPPASASPNPVTPLLYSLYTIGVSFVALILSCFLFSSLCSASATVEPASSHTLLLFYLPLSASITPLRPRQTPIDSGVCATPTLRLTPSVKGRSIRNSSSKYFSARGARDPFPVFLPLNGDSSCRVVELSIRLPISNIYPIYIYIYTYRFCLQGGSGDKLRKVLA